MTGLFMDCFGPGVVGVFTKAFVFCPIIAAENDADKELIESGVRYSNLDKDQLAVIWLRYDRNTSGREIAAYRCEDAKV